jgi:hypothetical protein
MKIAAIIISCFVFLVVPQFGWAGDCSPLQISFIPPYQLVPVEKDVCGLRLNLPVGHNHNIYGLDLGFWGQTIESNKGIMLNLIGNLNLSPMAGLMTANNGGSGTKGIQLAGLMNLNLGDIDGIQIAGLYNAGNEVRGIQIAGLLNGGHEVRGIQVAPVINFAASTMQGIQVAAVNYSEKATGLQCGLYNHAKSVRGIQIGLINVTQELSGLQIGLVNYIRESPVPILPIINLKF